jgi:hypothetical protein
VFGLVAGFVACVAFEPFALSLSVGSGGFVSTLVAVIDPVGVIDFETLVQVMDTYESGKGATNVGVGEFGGFAKLETNASVE